MKSKTPIITALLLGIFLFTFHACKQEDQVPLMTCSDANTQTEDSCAFGGLDIYEIVEEMPYYGDLDTDLADYVLSDLEIPQIEEVTIGEIILQLVILKDGSHCFAGARGKNNMPEGSLHKTKDFVDNMPQNWTAGKQAGNFVHAYFKISIIIIDGKIDSIDY